MFSGTSPDGHLVEFVELPRDVHPYYVATQAHPELRSRPTRPHPLFAGLVAAADRPAGGTRPTADGAVDLTAVAAGTASIADEPAELARAGPASWPTTAWSGTSAATTVDLGDGQTVTREVVAHPGAVGVLALDDAGPGAAAAAVPPPGPAYLWELPAGLLDVAGEDPLVAAAARAGRGGRPHGRRVARAGRLFNSPGRHAPRRSAATWPAACTRSPERERHDREHEERDMAPAWVDLDEARDLVLAGRLHNPTTVTGVLAAVAARDVGLGDAATGRRAVAGALAGAGRPAARLGSARHGQAARGTARWPTSRPTGRAGGCRARRPPGRRPPGAP